MMSTVYRLSTAISRPTLSVDHLPGVVPRLDEIEAEIGRCLRRGLGDRAQRLYADLRDRGVWLADSSPALGGEVAR